MMVTHRTGTVLLLMMIATVVAMSQPRLEGGRGQPPHMEGGTLKPPHAMSAADMLPTPYTAEQIREACPQGRTWVMRMTQPGGEVTYRQTTFVEVNDSSALMSDQQVDEKFMPIGESESGESRWEELRLHAQFPAALTTISTAELTTELGTYSCKVYRVQPTDPTKPARLFYFADDLPGPPIRLSIDKGSEEIVVMEMVRRDTLLR